MNLKQLMALCCSVEDFSPLHSCSPDFPFSGEHLLKFPEAKNNLIRSGALTAHDVSISGRPMHSAFAIAAAFQDGFGVFGTGCMVISFPAAPLDGTGKRRRTVQSF